MANILIENVYDWSYDGDKKWDFYNNKYYQQYGDPQELDFYSGSSIFIDGENLTFKKNGKGNAGDNHYYLTGGTVIGFTFSSGFSHTYINDISLSAKQLHTWMLDGSSQASVKIFAAILSGDDDITLGYGSDRIASFAGDDVIHGRAGNDWINAGAGDDNLYGGTGKDTLIGGSGEDYFIFDTKAGPKNVDLIDDFIVKDDTIVIDHLVFRGVGKAGDLASTAFVSNTTGHAGDGSDRIIYDSKTGALYFDADGTGKAEAVQFAKLDAHLKLTAADFDII